jgi:hypothetical protein
MIYQKCDGDDMAAFGFMLIIESTTCTLPYKRRELWIVGFLFLSSNIICHTTIFYFSISFVFPVAT